MSASGMETVTLPLRLEMSSANRRTTFRCKGELSAETAGFFRANVAQAIGWSDNVVLDLAGLTYIDSLGLGALVGVFTTARKATCECRVLNVTPRVMSLLQLTNLEKVLQPTRENLL